MCVGHGEEDISGEYNLYSVEELVKVGDYEVLLKGTGVIYNTAVWTHDGYTYAIMSELPLEKDAMISIIEEVK